jgi:hypothetical protein
MFSGAVKSTPQPRLEPVNRFVGRACLDLRAYESTVDLEVGLRDHGARTRGIATPREFHTRVAHLSLREPSECADLRAGVICRTGQLASR